MARKKTGARSSHQNDFVAPLKPVISSLTNVGTNMPYNYGSAIISFSLPTGSPAATNYAITVGSKPEFLINTTSSPFTIIGLEAGVNHSVKIVAINDSGRSPESDAVVVYASTVPNTVQKPSVGTQVNQDNLSWSAPENGGATITNYQWESNDGKSGTTSATSVGIAQEGSTAQAYRVRAYNANGWGQWSPWSDTITTTPPFFPPFFPPYFPYFPYFPWFPWFPPWFPWFPPWFPYFPWFPWFPPRFNPLCIAADTLVRTANGPVAAKDVRVGDKLLTYNLVEMDIDSEEAMFSWESNSLTFVDQNTIETEIARIVERASTIMFFNENTDAKYSTTQPVFVKIDGTYKVRTTGSLNIGDILIKVSDEGIISEEAITSITIEDEIEMTYQIDCEPYDWFIAGGYLVHNK